MSDEKSTMAATLLLMRNLKKFRFFVLFANRILSFYVIDHCMGLNGSYKIYLRMK